MATREITLYATGFGAQVGPFDITDNYGNVVALGVTPAQILASINLTVDTLADTLFLKSIGRCDNTLQVAINAIAPSPTVSPSITISPSRTPSVTPSITISPSVTPSISISVSATPSISITPTRTPSVTITPSNTPSISISRTPSVTPSLTPTKTPSASPSGLYYTFGYEYYGSTYYSISSIDYCEITSNGLRVNIVDYSGNPVTSHSDYAFTISVVLNGGSPTYHTLDVFNGSSSAVWNYNEYDDCLGRYETVSVSSSPLPLAP